MLAVSVIQTFVLVVIGLGVAWLACELRRENQASMYWRERLLVGQEHLAHEVAKEHKNTRELIENTVTQVDLLGALEVNTRSPMTEAVR